MAYKNQVPLSKYGIKRRAPKNFPVEVYDVDYKKLIEEGPRQLPLNKIQFFSRRQKTVSPDVVDAYVDAQSSRKSDVWIGETVDEDYEDYEHLEYPQVVLHQNVAEILDGHHRIAAAIKRKAPSVEAYVVPHFWERKKR
jgi:hypothetical protein